MSEAVQRIESPGMITVRGDLAAHGAQIAGAVGVALPATRAINSQGPRRLAWMAPDEVLVIVPRSEVSATVNALNDALQGAHHLVQDVSDMRAMFRLAGDTPCESLAKLVPADLHPDAFAPGELRRTRLAQIPCAFWLEEGEIRLICFRSVAAYAEDLLRQAASTAPAQVFPAG